VYGSAVITRLRKNVRLFSVPYGHSSAVKRLGYHWLDAGKPQCWKKIDGDILSDEEMSVLKQIPNIRIKVN